MKAEYSIRTDDQSCNYHKTYESFYKAYYGIVLGYLRKKINSVADAEDVAGKVFLYCFEKWETYDPTKASQATWLFMICRSRWTDFLRTNRSFVDIDELDEVLTNGEDQMENAIRLESIRKEMVTSLEKLPENQRKAIVMRYFGEYTDEEIANHLNTTAGNVRVIIHRGINKLKSEVSLRDLYQ